MSMTKRQAWELQQAKYDVAEANRRIGCLSPVMQRLQYALAELARVHFDCPDANLPELERKLSLTSGDLWYYQDEVDAA